MIGSLRLWILFNSGISQSLDMGFSLMGVRCAVICPIATGGGISEAFLVSLEMLRDGGVIPVAIVDENFVFLNRMREQKYEIFTIPDIQNGGSLNLVRQSRALSRAIKAAKVDILLHNNGRFVSALKWFLPHLPTVAIYHGGKISRFLKANRVLTINNEQLSYLVDAGYPLEQTAVVDNALPNKSLPIYTPRHFTAGTPVIGTLRLLEPAKGVDVLIEAISLLAKRGMRLKTLIGSNGSQRDKLEAKANALGIADIVEFRGWIGDKAAFFDEMDIYVLPSRAEEWGIGIVEANAARLPVIATACLGPKRIVKDGETGVLVPINDPEAMANAIESLALNPLRAEVLARAGYSWCAENYLYPKVQPIFVREVLETLQSLKD
jgi:glycosyltransferase involved in cell wall biosynthesis